eukprot:1509314-Rhodomonas_salina.2
MRGSGAGGLEPTVEGLGPRVHARDVDERLRADGLGSRSRSQRSGVWGLGSGVWGLGSTHARDVDERLRADGRVRDHALRDEAPVPHDHDRRWYQQIQRQYRGIVARTETQYRIPVPG